MNQNDDLWYALRENKPEKFNVDEIKEIVAEVPGENDELNWWWILRLTNKRFVLLSAWCDYTGWDCQSGIHYEEVFTTPRKAAKAAPETEDQSARNIRRNLMNQVKGIQPKFTFYGE